MSLLDPTGFSLGNHRTWNHLSQLGVGVGTNGKRLSCKPHQLESPPHEIDHSLLKSMQLPSMRVSVGHLTDQKDRHRNPGMDPAQAKQLELPGL